jgi:hypothetical protein
MRHFRFVLGTFVLFVIAHPLIAATYYVGSCRVGAFTTISGALAAVPAGSTIDVCPGTYNEQVHIQQSVTLQGIASGIFAQPVIGSPATGLTATTTSDFGDILPYQVWVDNTSGPVNLTDITVDGSGNGVASGPCASVGYVVGIFYQNSSGTVNHVTTRNQQGNGCGVGIWLEGGSTNPTVTVTNSSIHDNDYTGINAETNALTPELTTIIKGNYANSTNYAMAIYYGTTNTVTSNSVSSGFIGFATTGGLGSFSSNTVMDSYYGIAAGGQMSITSNKVINSYQAAIVSNTSNELIQSNSIMKASVGISFTCTADNNVNHNSITDVTTGLDQVPVSVTSVNSYFDVATIRSQGGC